MFEHRPAQDRGHSQHHWLDSWHSFSFAEYVDPERMGFSVLRVINDDRVAPGTGFATHAHRDMEIISVILQGTIEHKDSMGNVLQLHAGDVQRMSAGTGITHSEFNASADEELRFLQIWIQPNRQGIEPSYEDLQLSDNDAKLQVLASPDRRDGSLLLHQDAVMFGGSLKAGEELSLPLGGVRRYYLHVMSGDISVADHTLSEGDALSMENEHALHIVANNEAEFLLFDLP
ncbi:MAG TPA: pirin family protein [Gammaproteobacteria bacterium]|nr:pirin family protein [Gammaproteobacteria bacterium]